MDKMTGHSDPRTGDYSDIENTFREDLAKLWGTVKKRPIRA